MNPAVSHTAALSVSMILVPEAEFQEWRILGRPEERREENERASPGERMRFLLSTLALPSPLE